MGWKLQMVWDHLNFKLSVKYFTWKKTYKFPTDDKLHKKYNNENVNYVDLVVPSTTMYHLSFT